MTGTIEEAIWAALELCGSDVSESSRGYVHASCPLAFRTHQHGVDKHPSFGVVFDAKEAEAPVLHAHCFSCGFSGSLREIAFRLMTWGSLTQTEFSTIMEILEKADEGKLPLSLGGQGQKDDPYPDKAWMESFLPVDLFWDAMAYLKARGVSKKTAAHFDLRFDPQRQRICFPVKDRHNRHRGLIGRTILTDPEVPRYFYYPYPNLHGTAPRGFTWFNENDLDLTKPVVVVEGVFDALSVWTVYSNVTAALSVSFRTPALGWHHGVKRWLSFFDEGEGGRRARERLKTMVGKDGRVFDMDLPDGVSDPGDASEDQIRHILKEFGVYKTLNL